MQFWRHAHQRVQLILLETLAFKAQNLWLPNIPNLNRVIYGTKVGDQCRNARIYKTSLRKTDNLKQFVIDAWSPAHLLLCDIGETEERG